MNEELSGASDEPSESRRRDSVQGMLTRLYGGEGATAEAERLSADPRRLWPLGVVALAGLSTYGAVAGLFGGGSQPAITALKAPIVVLFALLLCLPSFAVTTSLAGVRWSGRRLLAAAAAFTAGIGLLLLTLLPIAWLFTVSSRYLAFLVLLHFAAWCAAVLFAWRGLRPFLGDRGRGAAAVWILLYLLVSLQTATYLQPILWQGDRADLFPRPRQFFLEHFSDAAERRLPE